MPGRSIADIPLHTPPTFSESLTVLRTRANQDNFYGQRLRGYLCPPVSGQYTFFIQGDDEAVPYLSGDQDPAHRQRMAFSTINWSWHEQASQQSAPMNLKAGQRYYLEVLHKEGSGGDMLRVGWRTPQMAIDAEPLIVPGSVLSPWAPSWSRQVTTVAEPPHSLSLNAHPNPTTGSAIIEFTAVERGWLSVQLYNQQGQLLQQLFGQLVEAASAHQQQLETMSLPAGLYLIRLNNGHRVTTQKLVIAR